jgi:sortase A
MRKLLLTGILFLGLAEFGYGAWIPAKAWLSQVLLAHAWQHSLDTGELQKPWPWADTWPVLKLTYTPSNTQLLVLQGDSGQAMAFGPGLTSSSMMPGETGNTIINAHRDTHFDFLEAVRIGETLIIQNRQGRDFFYQITAVQVVDSSNTQIQINTNDDRMTLVTCYPFNKITPGGDLRYVVTAIKQPSLHI